MNIYKDKFDEVLKHIHFNLDEKLDLKKLSNIAFISKFHFHRLIKAYLGEALGTYVSRVKIETSAKLLKYSDHSITEIAYKIGYETPTSFNKSFKKTFGISPSQFRENPSFSFKNLKQLKNKSKFKLKITNEYIADILILTNQSKGLTSNDERNRLWKKLIEFASKNGLMNESTCMYGITWDDPSVTSLKNLRYDACISIDNKTQTPFTIKQINKGNYLCFTYQGDYKYLGDVYDQIFKDYIIEENILLRETPLFEQYLNNINTTKTKNLLTKIFVPIQ